MRPGNELLQLTLKDRDAAAAVLGRAFAEDALYTHYFPDSTARRAFTTTLVFIGLSVCFKYGEVYASSEKLEGVAAWLPSGKAPFGGWQVVRSVALPVLIRFACQGASRMQSYGRFVDRQHRRLVAFPHWYLQVMGVDPAFQAQGFAGRLLRPMLARFDRESLPCFLETNTSKNAAIYQRFGFEVISEDRIPETELTSYAMLRRPPQDPYGRQ